jgi:hypothetical protein
MIPGSRTDRTRPHRSRALLGVAAGALAVGLFAAPADAQSGRDYLLGAPVGALTVRGGVSFLSARSEAFDFVSEQFTVSRSDFHSPMAEADLSFRLTPRLHLLMSGGYSSRARRSEFRDFEGTDDLPIEQETRIQRVPLSASAKFYVAKPGRSVGRFAWIPNRYAPYVGVGGGVMWHRFEMDGEFVDFEDYSIFRHTYRSSGYAPLVQGFAGVDITLSPRVALTLETRYQRARGEMGRDFVDFDRIDLSGLQTTAGVHLRF